MQSFKGVLVTLATPMDEAGRLDEPAFRRHLDGLTNIGCSSP